MREREFAREVESTCEIIESELESVVIRAGRGVI
jgi:hypothetical protein